MICVRELTKRFGEVLAVDAASFDVFSGELFGFLGPNGAGKTTTINLLTGLARPDYGAIQVGDIDCARRPKAAQHLMGVVPDESNLYPELSGFDNLTFCSSLYGMRKRVREERARELLQRFGLTDAAGRKFSGYSKGMKRKLTIAAGLIHDPQILFLDEPTTGIDVASARQIRQLIGRLNRSGTTVFLTTHYIEEAERLCGRIAFIVKGRIARVDSLEALMGEVDGRHAVEFSLAQGAHGLGQAVMAAFPEARCEMVSHRVCRLSSVKPIPIGPLVRFFEDRGLEVEEARKARPSLEEVFVRVTGIEAEALKKEKAKGGGVP
jgi:ABC-2 type transport system ATP-binding protein